MATDAPIHLDLRGLKCPLPALRTQKLLNRLAPGDRAIVECTDPLSVIDIPHLLQSRGDVLELRLEQDGVHIFQIRKGGQMVKAEAAAPAKMLAAVFFETSEEINATLADFAAALAGRGRRLAGVIQVSANTPGCACAETHVLDLESGARIPILQKLGAQSQACRADSAALADVATIVRKAVLSKPDLVFINRFGRLESEGKGMREEIAAAALSGIPVVIGVSVHYRDAWRGFVQDLAEELACSRAALDDWWRRLETESLAAAEGARI